MGSSGNNSLADLIATERNARGWTQKELADRIGVSTALVGRWETGDVTVTRANAERVAEALDIDKETVVTKAFVESMAESRRKNERKIQREYANYPQVLRLAEAMWNCPNCSNINRELEKISKTDSKLLELALDSLGVGIYIRDIKGTIVYANESLKKMAGIDKEWLLGRDIRFFSNDPQVSERLMEQTVAKGSYVGSTEFAGADNRKVRLVFLSYLIKNAYGNPVGVIGLLCDCDTFKVALEQLFAEASVSFFNSI